MEMVNMPVAAMHKPL